VPLWTLKVNLNDEEPPLNSIDPVYNVSDYRPSLWRNLMTWIVKSPIVMVIANTMAFE
jgi:hypothetical protein